MLFVTTFHIKCKNYLITFIHRRTRGVKNTLYEFFVASSVMASCVCSTHGTHKCSYSFVPRQAVLHCGFVGQPRQALTSSFSFRESDESAEIRCIPLCPLCPLVATLEKVWDLETGVSVWFCDGRDTAPLGYRGAWNKVRWQRGAISEEDEILPCCCMGKSNECFGSHCFAYRVYSFLWPIGAGSNAADGIANGSLQWKRELSSLRCIHTGTYRAEGPVPQALTAALKGDIRPNPLSTRTALPLGSRGCRTPWEAGSRCPGREDIGRSSSAPLTPEPGDN